MVNKPEGLSLDELLLTNVPLVMRYGQEAKQLAKETNELKAEFQDLLGILEHNLDEVLKQLREQENALHEAEKQHAHEKAAAIISGIIAIGFIIGGCVALCSGQAPTAAHFFLHAGVEIYSMIKDIIKAIGLAEVITNLKAAIERSKKTRTSLETLIPAFKDVVTLLEKIGSAWDSMELGLAEVRDNYTAWSNPSLFTPQMLSMTIESWKSISEAVERYIRTITGASNDAESNSIQKPMALMANAAEMNVFEAEVADSNEFQSELLSNRKEAMELPARSIQTELVRKIFTAPSITEQLLRRPVLQRLAENFERAESYLRAVGQDSLARLCESIVAHITQQVIPASWRTIDALKGFSATQPDVPSFPLEQEDWIVFCASRISSLRRGNDGAEASYTAARGLYANIELLSNFLDDRVKKLRIEAEELRSELKEKKMEQHEAEVLLMNPFAWPFSAINTYKKFQTAIENITLQVTNVTNELQQVSSVLEIADRAKQETVHLLDFESALQQFWIDLLHGTKSASNLWYIMNRLQLTPGEVAIYKATWDQVRNALGSA
jgi:hypothetical protein